MYYVHIAASLHRVLYIGVTNNVERRMWQHRNNVNPDSFAAKYRCHRCVHVEMFERITDALRREKELKAWRRDKKVHLIRTTNPEWADLLPPTAPGPSLRSG